ncbi:MAG: ribosome small subunit-dependent GTPase A [Flavobacteriales bacterium]|jgi:ribosome biogenesis GTPase|nr:ribosome small subunit-dependent GTPase A [Flavobacteriales bacterium]
MKGLVIKSTGSWYKVLDNKGKLYDCKIKGKFRIQGIRTTNPVAVGDEVEILQNDNQDIPLIHKIYPRRNYIIRKSVNLSKEAHILASNIDRAILIVTLAYPETSLSFIDRFLITAEAYYIPVTIVFNKYDLYDEELELDLEAYRMMYEAIGYDTLVCSAEEKFGLEPLIEILKDKTTLLSGHSGVGKSTLVNAIEPTLDLRTDEISDIHLQGKHTTTFAEMHPLSFGGNIIDTPGIRGFGLVYMDVEEIKGLFPEFQSYSKECKFHNCQHLHEPKCAVKAAVEKGELFSTRYENYLQFVNDIQEENAQNHR